MMEAKLFYHHPKLLQRWAETIVRWYKMYGEQGATERCSFLTPADKEAVNPYVKEEFKRQGFKM